MMKPSDSAQYIDQRQTEMTQHRNFNSTQPVGHFQSEEKAYPNRQ